MSAPADHVTDAAPVASVTITQGEIACITFTKATDTAPATANSVIYRKLSGKTSPDEKGP